MGDRWRGRDVRDELEFYLEERARELEAQGLTPAEARRRALEAFGDPDRLARECMETWEPRREGMGMGELLGSIVQDARFALRTLRRSPGFALVALTTLALGIGANTAIFSVADAALFTTPAEVDSRGLVNVYTTCRLGFPRCSSSYPDYLDYRDRSSRLSDLAVATGRQVSLGGEDAGSSLSVAQGVSGNYFSLLSVRPGLGRLLQPPDDLLQGPAQVVVVSHGAWRDQFGSDPELVGSTLRLNGVPFEVVGVAPEGFSGTGLGSRPAVWIPLTTLPLLDPSDEADGGSMFTNRGWRWMGTLVGRLAPGATVGQLREEMASISEQLFEEYPDERGPRSITVDEASTYTLPVGSEEDIRNFVWLLMGVVGFSLLLATANLANLLLTRATVRQREIGVRMAIGAGRRRVARQMITESVILSLAGGALGLLVAWGLLGALAGYDLPGGVPVGSLGVGLDGRILLFALMLSTATGLLFGLYPALQATRSGLSTALRGEVSGRAGSAERARGVLVAAQVTVSVILLAGAGAFLQTLRNGLEVDMGFPVEGVAVARFNLALNQYTVDEARQFVRALEERAEALPGVTEASITTRVPLQTSGLRGFLVEVDGYQMAPDEEIRIEAAFATPGLVETLGAPLLEGRALAPEDGADAEPVLIVNRTFAERYWPGGRATGGSVSLSGTTARVAGVFGNVSWRGPEAEPYPVAFATLEQMPRAYLAGNLTLVARTTGDPGALASRLQDEITALDPDVQASYAMTMEDLLAELLMPQRLGTLLLLGLSVLALVLAAVGIAGVVAYGVSRRMREVGIRIAVGASRGQVTALVLRGVALPVLAGIGVGMAATVALAGAASAFILFEVETTDPIRLGAVAGILVAVAMASAWLPARRAARVDPVTALRSE